MVDEGDNGNCKEEDSSDDEEANFEEDSFPGSEPIPGAHFQGITFYDQSNWHFLNLVLEGFTCFAQSVKSIPMCQR